MSNIEQLRRMLTVLDGQIAPLRRHTYSGPTEPQFLEFVQRAAVVRQWEALNAQVALSDANHGAFGVSMLRASYEEQIWMEYLASIPSDANELVILLGVGGSAKNVLRQADYIGLEAMQTLGFSAFAVQKFALGEASTRASLKAMGNRLGWDKTPPSFKWLSRAVGREREYNFVYAGTSSFVHFSAPELFRRVWGNQGQVTVGSSTFSRYWEEYAAYWAARTFVNLLAACGSLLSGDDDSDELSEMLEIAKELSPVPIVTAEELAPWPEGEPSR